MAREWKEIRVPGPGLGKIAWKHLHSDGTEHDTEYAPQPGAHIGLVGSIPVGARIKCLDCGAVAEGTDKSEIVLDLHQL